MTFGEPPRLAPHAPAARTMAASSERDVSRPRGAMRQGVERHRQRLPRLDTAAFADDVGLAVGSHLATLSDLRRRQLHPADFLRDHRHPRQRRRQLLREHDLLAAERHGVGELHEGVPRHERARHRYPLAGRDRVRRRALQDAGADRPIREIEHQRSASVHRLRCGIDDLQDVEHVQGVVTGLDHEPGLFTEGHRSRHGRRRGGPASGRGALSGRGIGGDEHQARAAGGWRPRTPATRSARR